MQKNELEVAMRNIIFSAIVGIMMMSATAGIAAEPAVNVDSKLNPNLAEAQQLSRQAYQKIEAAQKANKFKLEGHAQKAKELLVQVNEELKLAAEASLKNRGK